MSHAGLPEIPWSPPSLLSHIGLPETPWFPPNLLSLTGLPETHRPRQAYTCTPVYLRPPGTAWPAVTHLST
ncbi:hypothetical protein GWI33_012243 [Rhynchophorus ferrugineus]|uniref:Uncharacterized protein n=1 Tax=Rhynchophorus ferrugineus TaxID=354439 RepID=A0A834I5Q0_RHYFE|nr:hypothetical protein GWI33_012243 [Rhynchophorus ferrugineus]